MLVEVNFIMMVKVFRLFCYWFIDFYILNKTSATGLMVLNFIQILLKKLNFIDFYILIKISVIESCVLKNLTHKQDS